MWSSSNRVVLTEKEEDNNHPKHQTYLHLNPSPYSSLLPTFSLCYKTLLTLLHSYRLSLYEEDKTKKGPTNEKNKEKNKNALK